MKCIVCGKGKMEKIRDEIKQDGVKFEAYRCTSCGEEIMDMSQLKSLAGKYRALRKSKDIVFSKWGNSIAVRIPNNIVEEFDIESGTHGLITKDKSGIRIIPT